MAKNYIKGSIKQFTFDDGGSKLVASLLVEDLAKIANEKGYVSIVIAERKDPDQYGNTHYAYENDYKPKEKKTSKKSESAIGKAKAELRKPKFEESSDDMPF